MKRHEKLLRVYGDRRVNWALSELMARRGLAALSDDAIEELIAIVSRNYRQEKRTNAHNRAISDRAA
ncbi:MAG: hypothetical protein JWM36_3174 [Hyphomicrobiales bacterium]|nr:hypothetical protein [Hyphomicrobiales bacterium]